MFFPIDSRGVPGVLPQKNYPVEIKPRASETFYLSDAKDFGQQMTDIKNDQNFLGSSLFCLKKAIVVSADDWKFRARGDRGITAMAAEAR